ncbi:MAG: adenylate cyclase [Candidatus Azotimanducaceae bacterium]|jgi:adenylate cyclase
MEGLDGNQVRVAAQLIDAVRDVHIFSKTYDGDLDNIFRLQNDIARQVVAVVTSVVNADVTMPEKPRVIDGNAYNDYLEGRSFLRQPINEINLKLATKSFQSAIQKDSFFVQAYAGLCQTMLAVFRANSIPESFMQAEVACNRALT